MTKLIAPELTRKTINHYENNPVRFWEGTKDHDVSQNINALLTNINKDAPLKILDLGCGPGRDLKYLKELGHEPYGLDGCQEFCLMAKEYSGCEVFHQNFLEINLKESFFDGIFANASLFHTPKEHLPTLLKKLQSALVNDGVLFSSNPRGQGEGFDGSRYANLMEIEDYQPIVENAGFKLIDHYYRPQGLPKSECPWLACVFRKVN